MAGTTPSLVGRDEQFERLRDNVVRARSGERVTVLVDGEAGIGKSRLVAEAITRLRGADDLVVVGHGVELSGGELPYGTVSECVRSLVRGAGVEEVRSAAGESAAVLSALCPPLGSGVSPVEPTRVEQAQLFYGFVTMLESLASNRLVWLVLEDLHWTDASSRDLLSYLIKVAAPCRLATLVTVRTHDPAAGPAGSDIVADLVRVDGVERISIGALTREEVAKQVANLTQAPAPPALVDRVVGLTGGVPFLTEQLIAVGLTETSAVPATVLEPMQARIRTLDPDTQRLVQIASLADGHLTHDLLEQAYQLETSAEGEGSFGWAVASAVDAQVLQFDPNEHTYTFVHALLRQAVDAMVLPVDRRGWHRNLATLCAEALGQTEDLRLPIAVAYHWAQAGATSQAFDAALATADRCYRLGAMSEMAALLVRALELWDRVPDAAKRAGRSQDVVLSKAVAALNETADYGGAVDLLDTALARIRRADDPVLNLCLRLERDAFLQDLDRAPDLALYEEAEASLDLLLAARPSPWVVDGLVDLGWQLQSENKHELCLQTFRHAAERAETLGDLRLRGLATIAVSVELAYQGQLDDAVSHCRQFLERVPDSSFVFSEVELAYGVWLNSAGHYREAEAAFERILTRLRDPRFAQKTWADSIQVQCEVQFALGRWDLEQDLLARLAKIPLSHGSRTVWTAEVAGTLACHRGDLDTADRWLEAATTALQPDEGTVPVRVRVTYHHLQGQVAAARGDLIAAREHLAPLWQLEGATRKPTIWMALLLAAQVEAELSDVQGRPPDSTSDAAIAAIRGSAAQVPHSGRLADAWSAHLDAELARAGGRDDPVTWTNVVGAWRQVGHVPYLAYSLMRLASAHLGAGDRDAATAPLVEAFRIASDLGAQPLRLRVVDLAHQGRIRLDDGTARRPTGTDRLGRLTAREMEVLRLVAQGLSNNEIAQKLFISPKTASVHVSRILTKLGVNSRAKATAIAYEEHLLTEST